MYISLSALTARTTQAIRRIRRGGSRRTTPVKEQNIPARISVELIYTEVYDDRVEAQRREYAIKQLPRAKKEKLIKSKRRDASCSRNRCGIPDDPQGEG